jgi:hypothetical protein
MTIAVQSLSVAVKSVGMPLSGPTEDPDRQMLVIGVGVGADHYLDRSSSMATLTLGPLTRLEVRSSERTSATRSRLLGARLLQRHGRFGTNALIDCSLAKSGRPLVSP